MTFDMWIWLVCKYMVSKSIRKDEQYFFERINLSHAKLWFLDGIDPKEYVNEI